MTARQSYRYQIYEVYEIALGFPAMPFCPVPFATTLLWEEGDNALLLGEQLRSGNALDRAQLLANQRGERVALCAKNEDGSIWRGALVPPAPWVAPDRGERRPMTEEVSA